MKDMKKKNPAQAPFRINTREVRTPSDRPKQNLRLRSSLMRALREEASRRGWSTNRLIESALIEYAQDLGYDQFRTEGE